MRRVIFLIFVLPGIAHCGPWRRAEKALDNLNSTSNLGSFGTSESNANANGAGSTVSISRIVTGDTSSTSGIISPQSSIASQANCSDFSTSSAHGSAGANAQSTGNCNLNLDNTGTITQTRVAIGMEGQINSHGQGGSQGQHQANVQVTQLYNNRPSHLQFVSFHTSGMNQEAQINQTINQNALDGSAEAYQLVHGPQGTSSFSGVMASAQGDHIVTGTSETIMSHSVGQTSVETVISPFVSPIS